MRTIAWIGRNRRMRRDDAFLLATGEAWVYLSMVRLLLTRLAHEQVPTAFHYRRVTYSAPYRSVQFHGSAANIAAAARSPRTLVQRLSFLSSYLARPEGNPLTAPNKTLKVLASHSR